MLSQLQPTVLPEWAASSSPCCHSPLSALVPCCRHRFGLSDAEAARLAAHVTPEVPAAPAASACGGSCMDVGWQEVTEAALTQLLRTDLAKSSKEQAAALPAALQPARDCARLRKHLGLVCERLGKGMRLAAGEGGSAKGGEKAGGGKQQGGNRQQNS
jgi:Bardet-Biedl syndrome 9 protein